MQDILSSFHLSNPFVLQTVFAFACLALTMAGIVIGQKTATQGKLCMLFGVGVGAFTMWLLTTSYALLAPGLAGVFIFAFLASGALVKVACGTGGGGAKKPAAPTPPPASGPKA